MSSNLIVRLSALLLLAGCCDNNDADCTQSELLNKKAQQAEWNTPALVAEKDGVKLYCIHCGSSERIAYFTTPCGDAAWTEHHSYGKGQHEDIPKHVNGQGCDQ